MVDTLRKLARRLRYGESVTVVSGLPRSGTSMLMRMLEAGGMPTMTDDGRPADEDNPGGYYELERVKHLSKQSDRSWVRDARGRALKVISHLLTELPDNNFYRVLFCVRDLAEVIESQNTMLARKREPNSMSDERAMELYEKHLTSIRALMRRRANFEILEVSCRQALEYPILCATRINDFLGNHLDVGRMAGVVDAALYRNRGNPDRE